MVQLFNKPVKRIFAFGCSFTDYNWGSTWPEIVSLDLNVPLYNFGRSGAGNQYISTMISQADNEYNFNESDLVIVSWTNVCREDRWVNGNWITPGNIFTQGEYNQEFVNKWADPVGYLMRDLSLIKLTKSLLDNRNCQYHFIAMCDITMQINQSGNETFDPKFKDVVERVIKNYKTTLDSIYPSFFQALWNNDIYKYKIVPDEKIYGKHWSDGHPSPADHLQYLNKTFDHTFKESTIFAVNQSQKQLEKFISNVSNERKKSFALYELGQEKSMHLKEITTIKKSEIVHRF